VKLASEKIPSRRSLPARAVAPANHLYSEFRAVLAIELRRAIARKQLTASGVARQIGASRAMVYRLLRGGGAGVTLRSLARILRVLNATIQVRFM
jgi:DNA-binding phage protein